MTAPDRRVNPVAREEAVRLLAQALPEARQRAREQLVGILADTIVDAALAELDRGTFGAGVPQTSTPDDQEPASWTAVESVPDEPVPNEPVPGEPLAGEIGGSGLYAYAITRAEELDLAGVGGVGTDSRPRLITHDGLGLVVSDIELSELSDLSTEQPTEDSRLATLARGHDAVVRAAFEQAAVLPLRFGTVLPDADAAARLLTERHDAATVLLDRIAGNLEWGVRIVPDTSGQDGETDEPSRTWESGEPPSGAEYLAHRRAVVAEAEERDRRTRQLLDDTHEAMGVHAVDSVHRQSAGNEILLDVAYLVPQDRTAEFLADTERRTAELAEHGLRLETTGPWPPYSFARADFEEAG